MSRALVSQVLRADWDMQQYVATAAPSTAQDVQAAIVEIETTQPLKNAEPGLNGPQSNAVLDALRPIGAKIAPGMAQQDVQAWSVAIVAALSDLPPRVALSSLKEALHRPMRFLNEVEGVVREFAEIALEKQANALWRLRRLQKAMERAANPPVMIEKQPKVWTQEEIDEANERFASLRLKTRWKLVGTECENDDEAMSEDQARRERAREERAKEIDAQ